MAEVTNPETLLAALQQKLSRASAEVEDAAATKARAEGERAYTQLILASMGRHGFPQDHMAIVTALVDPETQAYEAAKAREAAAVTALAAAQKAVDMAALHVQLKASGAAGAFYGNK